MSARMAGHGQGLYSGETAEQRVNIWPLAATEKQHVAMEYFHILLYELWSYFDQTNGTVQTMSC